MSDPVRVVLVEDHTIVREGLRALLDDRDDVVVVAEADNGQDSLGIKLRARDGVDPAPGAHDLAGRCSAAADGALRCAQFCRLAASDCAAGQSCQPVVVAPGSDEERVIAGLGYCR